MSEEINNKKERNWILLDPLVIERHFSETMFETTREDVHRRMLFLKRRDALMLELKKILRYVKLSDRQKDCFYGYYFEHKTKQQIANDCGIHYGSVKEYIKRAIKKMRKLEERYR